MSSYPPSTAPLCPACHVNHIRNRGSHRCLACSQKPGWHLARPDVPIPQPPVVTAKDTTAEPLADALVRALRASHATLKTLASLCGVTPGQALDGLYGLQARGINVCQLGDLWSLEKAPAVGALSQAGAYRSRPDGTYRFGFTSDSHLCSKYAREDVLTDLYRRFRELGVDRVFHAGNWLEGEASFNRFTLDVHGMQPQIRYFVRTYPKVDGLTTYAVAGDDHEGWWCQREGVDIGKAVEFAMHEAGRTDWVDLGYMEAFVPLEHAASGKTSMLHVLHPGGGSAYATSYTVQKIAEAYEGGEKPAVAIVGHYHKMELLNSRNVWFIQAGCTKDADPWSRKKRLENAIGGGVCELEQDAETGAIVGCCVRFFRYFNREHLNGRWSHSGPVNLPERSVA
jgi:hypothetical protein